MSEQTPIEVNRQDIHIHDFIPCDDWPATCLCGEQES